MEKAKADRLYGTGYKAFKYEITAKGDGKGRCTLTLPIVSQGLVDVFKLLVAANSRSHKSMKSRGFTWGFLGVLGFFLEVEICARPGRVLIVLDVVVP